jgi:PAS domain S-box-containing protein
VLNQGGPEAGRTTAAHDERARRLVLALGLGSAAIILGGTALGVWSARSETIERAEARLHDLATVLAEQTSRAVNQVDGILFATLDDVAHRTPSGPLMPSVALHEAVAGHLNAVPQLRVLAVANRDGDLVALSDRFPPPRINVADRDSFKVHRDDATTGLHIGAPVRGRAVGDELVVPLSLRVGAADGEFRGTVQAGVRIAYFRELYASLDLGAGGAVRLYRADGTMLAGFPPEEHALGTKPAAAAAQLAAGVPGKVVVVHYAVGGERRIAAVSRLQRYPLALAVSASEANVLAMWRRYALQFGTLATAAAAFVLVLTALLSQRLAAERQLRTALAETEARWRIALDGSDHGVWEWDIASGRFYRSPRYLEMLGYAADEIDATGPQPDRLVHPDDRERAHALTAQILAGALNQISEELDLVGRDGARVAVLLRGIVVARDAGGKPTRVVGTATDVTERNRARAALADAHAELRLLAAEMHGVREAERTRIARELHDELGQALTALKMDLEGLERRIPPGEGSLFERTAAMRALLDSTLATTRRLSADLRPLVLDDLGLGAGAEWLAQSFSRRANVACSLHVEPTLANLGEPHATVLFRVMQESLTNVARHARASRVEVTLERKREHAVLTVRDDGVGMDAQAQSKPRTFGLRGIRERVLLVGGEVAIESRPGEGTTVRARIPLPGSQARQAA